jgi:hypothetical protein
MSVFSVPPLPFNTKGPVSIDPVKVAVPEVFANVTVPVVAKAPMLWVAIVPLMVIGEALPFNVPPVVNKLPPIVRL